MENASIDVQGMTCQGCIVSVTRVLMALPGVEEVSVVLRPGTATVAYDPARTDVSALKTAIRDAGYDVGP